MAGDDAGREPVYLFEIDGSYLFKHYFGSDALFSTLGDHYDGDEYRFEVPVGGFDALRTSLNEHAYEPIVVEDLGEFCVVKAEYTPHADVLRDSVVHWTRRGYNFFLLKDPLAVERAVTEHGATPADEIDLALGL